MSNEYMEHISRAIRLEDQIALLNFARRRFINPVELQQGNESSPISRLPTEMMIRIFKLTQNYEAEEDLEMSWTSIDERNWYWITVTHVCRAWRSVAIDCQALWTNINTGSHVHPTQTQSFLERSGASQLIVSHYLPGKVMRNTSMLCLHQALKQIHRIRELHICGISEDEGTSIQGYLSEPAPSLRTLVFQPPAAYDVQSLFGGYSPKLESIILRFLSSSWSQFPIMRGLKSLNLRNPTNPPRLSEIFAILEANPELTSIFLHTGPKETVIDRLPPLIPIQLSSLREINLRCVDYKLLSHLLSNIVFAKDIVWDIICENFPIHTCPSVIPSLLNRDMPCNSLLLMLESTFIRIETDPGDPIEQRENGLPVRSYLECNWDASSEDPIFVGVNTVFDTVCTFIENRFWSYAKELNIDIYSEFFDNLSTDLNAELWARLLVLLPQLQTINVHSMCTRRYGKCTLKESHKEFMDALLIRENGDLGFICPRLTVLRLSGFDFDDSDALPKLLQCLSIRAEHGLRLRRLEIFKGFGVTDPRIDSLRQSGVADKVIATDEDDVQESDSEDEDYLFGFEDEDDIDIEENENEMV